MYLKNKSSPPPVVCMCTRKVDMRAYVCMYMCLWRSEVIIFGRV